MRAVWTFWTKPFLANASWGWLSERHHLLSWILSVETARHHFPSICLYTDSHGAYLLVDRLGLRFDTVSTALDSLRHYDPRWWTLGKLHAYRSETSPFVHIDSDAYLWKAIDPSIIAGDLFAQNAEYFSLGASEFYMPEVLESFLLKRGGWLPTEWLWARTVFGACQKGIACGVFGGQNLAFIRYYAELAFRLITDSRNAALLPNVPHKARHAILLEQYLLSACVDYHHGREGSPFKNLTVKFLFDSFEDAYFDAGRIGLTHLLANTKKDPILMRRLEDRVAQNYPDLYDRCLLVSGR